MGSGIGSLALSFITGETKFILQYIPFALLLGFVAYGLSIFTYIRAQKVLGAAKTISYYSIAPFIGVFLAFILLHEKLSAQYFIALLVMIAGTALVVYDTMLRSHQHSHTFTHTHDGSTHTHTVVHAHLHKHFITDEKHGHHHSIEELEREAEHIKI